MNPKEELQSLKECPLPESPEDKLLPTRIAMVDSEIIETREKLKDLESTRALLLDHAIKTNHLEDQRFKIEVEIKYGNRVADATKLATKYPKEFSLYVMAIANKKLRDVSTAIDKAKMEPNGPVLLGIADEIFGKKNVDSCSEIPETKVYVVKGK